MGSRNGYGLNFWLIRHLSIKATEIRCMLHMYMVHWHKIFFFKLETKFPIYCYRLLTSLLARSLWWSIHLVDLQYSSGFIGGPTPLPAGKPKTKGVLLDCCKTTQERMRIRQFNTHIGLILMVIPHKFFLEMASSSPQMMLPCAFLGNFRWRWKCVKSPVACAIE